MGRGCWTSAPVSWRTCVNDLKTIGRATGTTRTAEGGGPVQGSVEPARTTDATGEQKLASHLNTLVDVKTRPCPVRTSRTIMAAIPTLSQDGILLLQ